MPGCLLSFLPVLDSFSPFCDSKIFPILCTCSLHLSPGFHFLLSSKSLSIIRSGILSTCPNCLVYCGLINSIVFDASRFLFCFSLSILRPLFFSSKYIFLPHIGMKFSELLSNIHISLDIVSFLFVVTVSCLSKPYLIRCHDSRVFIIWSIVKFNSPGVNLWTYSWFIFLCWDWVFAWLSFVLIDFWSDFLYCFCQLVVILTSSPVLLFNSKLFPAYAKCWYFLWKMSTFFNYFFLASDETGSLINDPSALILARLSSFPLLLFIVFSNVIFIWSVFSVCTNICSTKFVSSYHWLENTNNILNNLWCMKITDLILNLNYPP